MTQPTTTLQLNDLCLPMHIGVPEEERAKPQDINIDITIAFSHPIKGCENDTIEDTVCYDQLVQAIKAYCQDRSFKLIESLACQLHTLVGALLKPKDTLTIKVTKCNPPIRELGTASFEYHGEVVG